MYKLLIFILFSFSAIAQVQSGGVIKAQDIKSSSFNIGDIKHSILTEAQFQTENGDCWRLMNNQVIAGTRSKEIQISYQGTNLENLVAGEYGDTVTFTILAN